MLPHPGPLGDGAAGALAWVMNRMALVFGMSAAALALGLAERDAAACGGCFTPPTQVASDITDERMLLSVSPTQTTLYDQIRYVGNPASFAWVLPIHGTVDVGLSADVLFDSIDALTATQIVSPPRNCPSPPSDCRSFGGAPASAGASADGGTATGVTVTKQENVGPYATVQLRTTDPQALNGWLAQNGFSIPADVTPILDEYVKEGFDFLAMKLLPSQGVKSMRPVRITAPGASLSLPLRMAAIGTGATVGITIWVVSGGRYEPQNFPFFHIEDTALVWDWKTSSSNYTTLRAQNAASLKGKGWEMESSLDLNENLIASVINNGGRYYGRNGYSGGPPADPSADYLPVGSPDGGAEGGVTQTPKEVRDADIKALFAGLSGPNVRVTRMRSDISHAAMNTDFVLRASSDQAEISNVRTVTESVNLTCPIYNGCSVVGSGTPAEAAASVAPKGAGSFACATSSQPSRAPVGLAALAGMIGLVVLRVVRTRRRASSKA